MASTQEPATWPPQRLSDEDYARLRGDVDMALSHSCPFTCQVVVRAWRVRALFNRIEALEQEARCR